MKRRAFSLVCGAAFAFTSGAGAQPMAPGDDEALPPLPPPPAPSAPPAATAPPQAAARPPAPVAPPRVVVLKAPPRRFEGVYVRTSIGVGGVGVWGRGPSGSASIVGNGPALGLAVGGSLVPGVALGASLHLNDTTGTFHGSTFMQADVLLVDLALFADWYPNPAIGWHLGGQVGLGGLDVSPNSTGPDMSSRALGGALFGGYDWRFRNSRWAFGVLTVASAVAAAPLEVAHSDAGYKMQGFALSLEGTALLF